MSQSTRFQSYGDRVTTSWVKPVLWGVNASFLLRTQHGALSGDHTQDLSVSVWSYVLDTTAGFYTTLDSEFDDLPTGYRNPL